MLILDDLSSHRTPDKKAELPTAPPDPTPLPKRPVRSLAPVLFALGFATLVCVGMLGARLWRTHAPDFAGLGFNLFLAWIPLGLSLLLRRIGTQPGWPRRICWVAGFFWILFFPNSFYIVTDLLYLQWFGTTGMPKWFDMIMTVGFVFTGVFLGTLALYLLHLMVRKHAGPKAGWSFAVGMLALASVGIYVGRFMRWNSWDVLTHPTRLAGQIGRLVEVSPTMGAFSATFFVFSLMAYFFVVGMARLHEGGV